MRAINVLELETPSDREVVIKRSFDAARDLVFDAYTKPELLRRWMLGPPGWTMPVCDVDLRVGGAYRFVWQSPEGSQMGMGGVYRDIQRPSRLVTTERFDMDWTGGETISTLVLREASGRTLLTNTILYASKEARDGALATNMAEGVEAGFKRLDELVAGRPAA